MNFTSAGLMGKFTASGKVNSIALFEIFTEGIMTHCIGGRKSKQANPGIQYHERLTIEFFYHYLKNRSNSFSHGQQKMIVKKASVP
jgi:hypothetical protein